VASAGPYASLHRSRQITTTQFFTGRMRFLLPNQQRQSTEGTVGAVTMDFKSLILEKAKLSLKFCNKST